MTFDTYINNLLRDNGIEIKGDIDYIKHQAQRAATTHLKSNKENFLWRILSNNNEPNLSADGSLTPSQWEKAQAIADKVLSDA
ncbi:MAG: hypothetical protein QNJ68_07915 [Microcoleaceae cyanobacterium MO_207.B10]|nr:hypothetical protein [Microcoleaceae cyanobacterium MO_207.B10]